VAVRRGEELITSPSPELRLCAGDQLALIGMRSQVSVAESLATSGPP